MLPIRTANYEIRRYITFKILLSAYMHKYFCVFFEDWA